MKILLVEDDPLMVRMYQRKLLTDGYEVEVAVNGEEGLVRVRSFRPDVVLLDIMMPKLNGLQVLERMKSDPTTARVPVVILTNLGGSEEDIERGLTLGAVAYLVKSAYRPDEVIIKVKEVLSGYMHAREIPQVKVSEGARAVLEQTSGSVKPLEQAAKPLEQSIGAKPPEQAPVNVKPLEQTSDTVKPLEQAPVGAKLSEQTPATAKPLEQTSGSTKPPEQAPVNVPPAEKQT